MPAFATTTSIPPNSCTASSARAESAAMSRTSASREMTRWPVFSTRATVSARSSGVAAATPLRLDLRADVGDDDVGAFLREPDGMGAALPSRSAGDEGDPAR